MQLKVNEVGKIVLPFAGESSYSPVSVGHGIGDGFLTCPSCEILTAGIYFLKNRFLYILVPLALWGHIYTTIQFLKPFCLSRESQVLRSLSYHSAAPYQTTSIYGKP